jgi:undecaprenyl diphosphate synthase
MKKIPFHVAIILDGNGRWAQQRGLPRMTGHRRGVHAVFNAISFARKAGISVLSLFGFSTENWQRPAGEVQEIMRLLEVFLRRHRKRAIREKIRVHWLGSPHNLPVKVVQLLRQMVVATENFENFHLALAINYGSRDEILRAIEKMGPRPPAPLTWEALANRLDTRTLPDVDLLIRPSGELRISNFLLLQSAYAELYFTPCLWPDFDDREFQRALDAYAGRHRRFGREIACQN